MMCVANIEPLAQQPGGDILLRLHVLLTELIEEDIRCEGIDKGVSKDLGRDSITELAQLVITLAPVHNPI